MRTAPALACALLLACAAPPQTLRAQAADAPAADTPEPDPLAALPADLRDKFNAALEKMTVAQRVNFQHQMKVATVALVEVAGMSSDVPLKDLAAAARTAVDRSLTEWTRASRQRITADYQQDSELAAAAIEAMAKAKGSMPALDDGAAPYTPPDEQSVWTEAVRNALTPAQLAVWQTKADEAKKERQETAKFLDVQTDRAREQCEPVIHAHIAELTDALDLPADRVSRFEALGRRAIEQTLRVSRAGAVRTLQSMSAAGRQRMRTTSQYFLNVRGDFAPDKQEVWTIGLDKLLTDADRHHLSTMQAEHETRRVDALGRMLLVVMDERTALTAPQRDRLLAAAEAAVKQEKALFPAGDNQNSYQYSRESFVEAAGFVPEETARAVLDAVQWQHWREACKESAEGRGNPPVGRGGRRRGGRDDPDQKEPPAADNAEPEELERFLSDAFDARTAEERQRELAVLLLKTEDAARVADLGQPTTARLQTAARGTVEETLVSWKMNVAQNVRAQMENSDPENVRNLLANLSNMQFGTNDPGQDGPENRSLWDKTVDRELTAPQRAAWQREVEARTVYKEHAIAALVLAEFDRRYQIPGAQWDKIQPLLLAVMRDYGREIHRTFAYSPGSAPWYFQSYTMFLPLMGIPEHDLKTIIGPDRWARWDGSPEHANGVNYWQNVQQIHDQKVKGNNE